MLDIRNEIEFLVEVKDIRDEINIILSVLQVQRNIIPQLNNGDEGHMSFCRGSPAEEVIETDIADFTKLTEQARTMQDKVRSPQLNTKDDTDPTKLETLMDLKQKAANAWEAREARETAVAASKQGNVSRLQIQQEPRRH